MVAVGICHLVQRARPLRQGPRPDAAGGRASASMWAAAELIEAASRTGQAWLAAGALTGLSEARASARPTGGRESMPAAGPCSATARTPRPVIVRRSIG